MRLEIIFSMLIPFFGTILGASAVFFFKKNIQPTLYKILIGFASGVMVAASIWSLIIPALEESSYLGRLSFIPTLIGFIIGIIFLLLIDKLLKNKTKYNTKNTSMLMLAVTLHNIPEGMAVGVVLAEVYYGNSLMTIASALALCIGIAIQNIPEGAIISTPLITQNKTKRKSFLYGIFSGIVEPISAIITFWISAIIKNILPYILSLAAAAMLYVVVEELIPESQRDDNTSIPTISFSIGFLIMMILDVALG